MQEITLTFCPICHTTTKRNSLITDSDSDDLATMQGIVLQTEQLNKRAAESQMMSQSVSQSKMIKVSQTKKLYQFQVCGNRNRVVGTCGNSVCRSSLGQNPLLLSNVYTWKLRYQGNPDGLFVGVIDNSMFDVDGDFIRMITVFKVVIAFMVVSQETRPNGILVNYSRSMQIL
ncbi:hypothetical protein GEMRC1_000360 [Eukaryota sp. GEM-RC1]